MEKIYKIVSRAWSPGDLVKIKSSSWDGRTHNSIGIVIREVASDTQVAMFPAVIVYDSILREQRALYLYDIELISAAT